jgi:hypothetical protein
VSEGSDSAAAGDLYDGLTGLIVFTAIALVVIGEWGGGRGFHLAGGAGIVVTLALMTPRAGLSRKLFVLTGIGLAAIAVATRPDWADMVERGLRAASFVAAFFLALAWLRNAASTSSVIGRCGRFLAAQPPGRRYLALSVGGHLFGIALSYGSIALLGSLAEQGVRTEPDEDARRARLKRMLLAIQRGFLANTAWSPLTFSIAITTSIIAGSSWTGAVGGCLVTALVLIVLGWVLDALAGQMSRAGPERPVRIEGSWAETLPLAGLLVLLFASVAAVQALTGVRAVAVILAVVPAISLGWIWFQSRDRRGGPLATTAGRAVRYIMIDGPAYRSELVLLAMAAFIGTMASGLLQPVVAGGLDLSSIPGPFVLVALVWLMPITGQLAMNPILGVYLIAPLLPDAEALGVSPNAIIVALTAGWALSGVSSPYTASTLLVAALGKVTALDAGPRWNGLYTLIGCVILSAWVVIYAAL